MRTKQLFLTLALLCAVVQGAWAQANWDEVYAMTGTTSANWTALTEGSTSGKTIGTQGNTTYYYTTNDLSFTNNMVGGSGLTIEGTVYLYVPQGVTVTCTGADADGATGAGAGIELAAGNALCLLGKGAVSATGGDAADGGDGLKGGDADWDSSNYWSGTGGTGGYGGGGAGAGIGTRGGDGGAGGAGAASVISKWSKWDHLDGGSGFAGQAGATAGAMGEVYKTNSFGSLTVTGGAAGSSGSAGGAGKSMLYDGTGYNYTTAGGGGGGAGGFGGAASNIGTGGPGGGGGAGGASGILDWSPEPGYYVVKAPGGKGGQNANGTWAAAGAESIMNHNAIKTGQVKINTSGWEDDKYNYDRYVSEQAVGTGGSGGARGSASTSESTITLNMKIPTQEEWDMVCQQTNTSQSQWCALLPGGRKGVTIGIAGTTTYYFATGDCSFTGVNAGSSGLTIKGTVYIYVPQGMTITCTGTHASGTTGAGAGIELAAGNALCLIGQGSVSATGGNAANGGNGANGRDASCDWEKIRWAWVGGDGHGGYGGGGAGAGIGTRGGDGGAGGSAPASEIYYSTWVENGVAGSAGGAGLTADAMGSLYVTEFFGSLTATGGAAGSKSGSAGSAGKSCLHVYDKGITSLPGGGGGGAGGFGGAASNIGTGGPGGGGGGGGAKGSHTWAKQDFFKIFASGGGGGQNADGSFAAYGGTAGVSKANVENGLCATNKKDWVKEVEERVDSDVPPATIGGSGGAAGAVSLALWPTQGMGEENSPYLISNEYEWNTFANNVSLGHGYSGQYVKLANDISVTQKCGTVSGTELTKAFSGTFDGDGHTITAAITDTGNQGTALFCYINGATIKNLKVAGTITGGMHAAAIVGTSKGTGNVIEGCVATANVIGGIYIGGTYVGGTHIGGILGHGTTSDIAISGCVFSGMMTGGGEPKGALFGWGDNGGEKSVTDCLYVMADGQDTRGLDLVRMNSGTVSVTNCYKTTSVGTYGTQCIFTTSAPSQLGTLVHDYGVVKAYENALFWDGKYYIAPTTSTNAGTEGDPYIIANETDWASFAQWIKEKGDGFTGEYVQLTADITASTPAGTSEAPFGGTFLGNGHTITANITDTSNGGTALFRYINGATIKDLTVGGTITSNQRHMSGLVGFADSEGEGKNLIEDCAVTATLNVNTDYAGGIVGHGKSSATTIRGCVFAGTMNSNSNPNVGVIWGWSDSGTPTLENCLEAGTYTGISKLHPMGLQGGSGTIDNCYYVTPQIGSPENACTVSGARQAYALATTPANLGNLVKDYGLAKAYQNGILYGGTYYVIPRALTGSGTEESPYIIDNDYDWNCFAYSVTNGTSYSGEFVKLNNDISVSEMVGSSETNSFQGTFLGGGHTITAAMTDNINGGAAPFRYIKNATIKNLTVAGTITSNQRHMSGLVGFADSEGEGKNLIEGCTVTATLNINTDYAGGIIGHGKSSATTIRGCVFAGTMNSNSNPNVGVIWGWSDSATPTLENSLEAGTYTGISKLHPMGLQKAAGTITNCYYVTPQIGSPEYACTVSGATKAYPMSTAPYYLGGQVQDYGLVKAYENGILYGGKYYMAPAIISLADDGDNSTTISEAHGYVADVTLQGRTLYKDGAWNTLCLPFNVDDFNGTPLEGATVKTLESTGFSDGTLTMNFTENVNGIEAGKPYIVKWEPVDLSTLTTHYTAQDGETLTGTLGANVKISIAAGATVKLQDVTINGTDNWNYAWAGISCLGNATIILKGTNNVSGFYENYSGIYVPSGSTLTIKGSGSLTARGRSLGAGIGAEYHIPCGNIVIEGGTINAYGGWLAAGIGGANQATCGYITITDGVTKVYAESGAGDVGAIGAGYNSSCGTVTIGGTVGAITASSHTYTGTGSGSVDVAMPNLVNPEFKSVINSDAPANIKTDYVDFVGTYSPVSIYTARKTNLYLGADNTLYYPTASGFTVNAFRGYFQLKGLTAGEPTNSQQPGVRAFVLNFGEGSGESTGIISVDGAEGTVNGSDMWYTLDGRKLQGKPTQRGIYINNGKKVVIK